MLYIVFCGRFFGNEMYTCKFKMCKILNDAILNGPKAIIFELARN